jgi:hypothetical protein
VRTLGVSRNSPHKEPWCWSGPEGTCAPDQARLSASLINGVFGPAQLDLSRCCVPLTRGLRIPWGILCGSLQVSGDSAGKEPRCCFFSFLDIFQGLPCVFLIFLIFHCVSQIFQVLQCAFLMLDFFQFSRHILVPIVYVSHFACFSVFSRYSRSYKVHITFPKFFSDSRNIQGPT